ncbi:ATP-grasp domain-containing protein [Alkalicoccobacillus murimartini]|uniref:Ribosomal protein S6--L-glutamate ligase n=1 Tax=Alkalicoccobacillus murimartini TaxID=171685 RepID=A0ABT9YFJ6_9BACI|nr:RimK family alpha-L-glutamate ligase [Alkalicoccobacillus murimartini]MDQ0206471.1 ribosomal protein S6--L-glutamate ligase [Alkalicoccobacillus murimartini]
MNLVTFNPFRTIGLKGLHYIKPENMYKEKQLISDADVCLFPENWQVNSLVYGMKKRIFPSIQSIQLGFNKIEMTRALWSVVPELVPKTVILGRNSDTYQKVLQDFPFPFVAKEIRSSMGRGVFLIENEQQFREYSDQNPTYYIQEYLPIERDLRVCIVGDKAIASYWRENENTFKNNVAQGGRIIFDDVPAEAVQAALSTAQLLGIDHAGFDLIVVEDKMYILEFNTLFGNQGFQELQVSVEEEIASYLGISMS